MDARTSLRKLFFKIMRNQRGESYFEGAEIISGPVHTAFPLKPEWPEALSLILIAAMVCRIEREPPKL